MFVFIHDCATWAQNCATSLPFWIFVLSVAENSAWLRPAGSSVLLSGRGQGAPRFCSHWGTGFPRARVKVPQGGPMCTYTSKSFPRRFHTTFLPSGVVRSALSTGTAVWCLLSSQSTPTASKLAFHKAAVNPACPQQSSTANGLLDRDLAVAMILTNSGSWLACTAMG